MSLYRETKGEGRGTAFGILPRALAAAYAIIVVHGLLLLAGADMALAGPSVTPGQCLAAGCLYLLRRLWRAADNDREPESPAGV
ncbi:hypothetical protein ALI144C_19535 [Actinosynnema sp. ALI-1.44]|uniref:hypothetical protein n=1 Tax=Actinosynnema sp. ALI-1.44 TaxID=1933779 RepID=UPI00097BBB86|nr:hypothetical protein [Actinosynnema sp. ALI-1.44]ONI81512.1 hypothetical protein ALI144C_19535 [Actinosynnema sp. ALI-1.44]